LSFDELLPEAEAAMLGTAYLDASQGIGAAVVQAFEMARKL
jgi:hypothetical protein